MLPDRFRCLLVEKHHDQVTASFTTRATRELPPDEVTIQVRASSLNYKDALATQGHPGIVHKFPHVPGIDAWGVVAAADDAGLVGHEVIVTGREVGVERWGGWAELLRVPAAWVQRVPGGLTGRECMQLGTAGFTAAQCVHTLIHHGITPTDGPVAVTGATGGVGMLSIMLLAKLGYSVTAVSGKPDQVDRLKHLGAKTVLDRDALAESSRLLLSAKFAAGIDTVGGHPLAALLKQIQHRGCVASCGVAAGADLPLTVYPFILRGITLAGIDSAWCPDDRRREIWELLGDKWKLPGLDAISNTVSLEDVMTPVGEMLAGRHVGRTVVELGGLR